MSQKPMKGISPNFGHRCILVRRCADSFWGQRVKSHGHSRQWPEEFVNTISQKNNYWELFHPTWVIVVYGFIDMLISLWDQKVKVTAGESNELKNRVNAISLKLLEVISPHTCTW